MFCLLEIYLGKSTNTYFQQYLSKVQIFQRTSKKVL